MMRVICFILSIPFLRHLVVGADIGSFGRLGLRMQRHVRKAICESLLVLFVPPPRDKTLRAMRCVGGACEHGLLGFTTPGGIRGKVGRKGACMPLVPYTCQYGASVMEALLDAP